MNEHEILEGADLPEDRLPEEDISPVPEEAPLEEPVLLDIPPETEVESLPEEDLSPVEEIPQEEERSPEEEIIPEEAYAVHHEALDLPQTGEELTADDHAMYSAGLFHPEDAEIYAALPPEEEPNDTAYRADEEDSADFQQMMEHKDEPVSPPPPKERLPKKGRPKRKKGSGLLGIPHMMATVIWLAIVVAIGVTLGRVIWVCAADVLAFGREEKEVSISVTTDDTMETITEKLHQGGLIRYPKLFMLYAELTGVEEKGKITTGTFTLNTIYDYHALVNQMSPRSVSREVVEDVLIPEGYSCRQIFALLEEKGICKAADLEEYAANGELDDYWFLEDVERGDKYCLEGFLFPDTYDFYENSTPRLALEKMLDGFDYRFTDEMNAQLPVLNERLSEMMRKNGDSEEFIAAHQLSLRDLITVASLIEEETANNAESFKIASVIYNRLFSWGNSPRYLNIDAAIFYALGYHKEALTQEDLQIDSPYNTYTNTGLIPGPISNPGLASLNAALNPEDTSYFYYVLDPEEGAHRFNKTLAAHEKDVKDIYGG